MNEVNHHLDLVAEAMSFTDVEAIAAVSRELKAVREARGNVWIVGNGGSAATASHLANDLVKMCKMRAFSVPDMTSVLMAYGNDNGWRYMFRDTIKAYLKPGDCIIGITCSGESTNVILALELKADSRILLTGPLDDSVAVMTRPNHILYAMAQDITVMEDIHMIMCHAIVKGVMER